jgi:hypothetical protein
MVITKINIDDAWGNDYSWYKKQIEKQICDISNMSSIMKNEVREAKNIEEKEEDKVYNKYELLDL